MNSTVYHGNVLYYIAVVVGRLEHRSLSTTRKGTVFGFRFFKFSRLHEKLVLIMDDFVMQDVSTYVIKRWSIPPQPGELMVDGTFLRTMVHVICRVSQAPGGKDILDNIDLERKLRTI